MFGELIKLRELARLMRRKQYEAVLEQSRDPAIRDHRKAREALDRARKAILDRAEKHRQTEDFTMALKDVRCVMRGEDHPRARNLETLILRDLEAREERARSLAQEKERARMQVQEGDLSGALHRLEPLAEQDRGAASFARDLKEKRAVEDDQRRDFQAALQGGDLEAALTLARRLHLEGSGGRGWEADYTALVSRCVERKETALLVRAIMDGRRRGQGTWAVPAETREEAAARILDQVERGLKEDESGRAAEELLAVFPLGSALDARAETLARAVRRQDRARRLFDEGQAELAADMAREALGLHGRCAGARAILSQVEKMLAHSKGALDQARKLVTTGQLLKAREILVGLLEEFPKLGAARDLLASLEDQEKADLETLGTAREKMQLGDLQAAKALLFTLSTRRPDLDTVPVQLRDVERRLKEQRLEGFAQESLRLSPREAAAQPADVGGRAARGANAPAPAPPSELRFGQPFVLRVEERGDWLAHPGDNLVLGNSMAGAADLPILAAIGSRHARLRRRSRGGGRVSYHLDVGPGKRVLRNRQLLASEVELNHGDLVSLGDVVSFTFLRPVAANDTAVLRLEGNFLVHGCNKILLFAQSGEQGSVVIGPGPEAHVPLGPDRDRVELIREPEGTKGRLLARCPYGVNIAEGDQRPQVVVVPGLRVHTVDVDFFIDPL